MIARHDAECRLKLTLCDFANEFIDSLPRRELKALVDAYAKRILKDLEPEPPEDKPFTLSDVRKAAEFMRTHSIEPDADGRFSFEAAPNSVLGMLADGKSWEEIALTLGCRDGIGPGEV